MYICIYMHSVVHITYSTYHARRDQATEMMTMKREKNAEAADASPLTHEYYINELTCWELLIFPFV